MFEPYISRESSFRAARVPMERGRVEKPTINTQGLGL